MKLALQLVVVVLNPFTAREDNGVCEVVLRPGSDAEVFMSRT